MSLKAAFSRLVLSALGLPATGQLLGADDTTHHPQWVNPPVSGGTTGFTPSQNTASPNNTANASRLLVDAVSSNADFVIQSKGSGAILAVLPDGTATGGNKRGMWAVDLQVLRALATQVASGNGAVIGGGYRNTASGSANASVLGGYANIASGNYTAIGGGFTNTAASDYDAIAGGEGNSTNTGQWCSITGGKSNSATNSYAAVLGGLTNIASGIGSVVSGQYADASLYGERAHAAGRFAAQGDCQERRFVVRRSTTDATQSELFTNGSNSRMTIPSDTTWTFSAQISARRTDANDESAGYKIEGVIDNNAGTVALVGTPTVTVLGEDNVAWDVVAEADNTNDALVFKVTGESAKTIRWGASVLVMQITG